MSLDLKMNQEMHLSTDRVKSCDFHPTEPWVLLGLYTGHAVIYNFETKKEIKRFEATDAPVRCARFIARYQWIVVASDDLFIRAYNYNTQERVAMFEAHQDFIRYLEPHPTLPFLISTSDDMTAKLWDFSKRWKQVRVFEGHGHYVMMARVNPKDSNTFATASLDGTIKVWSLNADEANYTLSGHESGVNALDFYPGGDKPYLISGSDDQTVKIWDYQTRSQVTTISGHSQNVTAVRFHPRLPVFISGSEDGNVRICHSATYKVVHQIDYSMDRCWTVDAALGSNKVAIGYDTGFVVIKLGSEMPVTSLDQRTGKLVLAQGNTIQVGSLRQPGAGAAAGGAASGAGAGGDDDDDAAVEDGTKVNLNLRELGSVEAYPNHLNHNSNGTFLAVVGDKEYVIYTASRLRSKSFGQCRGFAWSSKGSTDFCVLEGRGVQVFRNFEKGRMIAVPAGTDRVFGGALVGAASPAGVQLYDWEADMFVHQFEVADIRGVHWSDDGQHMAITTGQGTFILKYDSDAVVAAQHLTGVEAEEVRQNGVESAFELVTELPNKASTASWVGECFLFVDDDGKLSYYIGGQVVTVSHLKSYQFLLGYYPQESKCYVMDRDGGVFAYSLSLDFVNYQTAVMKKDFVAANSILPRVPRRLHTELAKFLDSQGYKEEALGVTRDLDHKFDLAVQLGRLDEALGIARSMQAESDETEVQARWKQLTDLALSKSDLQLAERCALAGEDYACALMIYTSTGSQQGLLQLAGMARRAGRINVAFMCLFLLQRTEDCVRLLLDAGRIPEAAFFARSYAPSMVSDAVASWKGMLTGTADRAAQALADPAEYPNLFEDFETSTYAEGIFVANRDRGMPTAADYAMAASQLDLDVIELVKQAEAAGQLGALSAGAAGGAADAAAAAATASGDGAVEEAMGGAAGPNDGPYEDDGGSSDAATPQSPSREQQAAAAAGPEEEDKEVLEADAAPSSPAPAPAPAAVPVASPAPAPAQVPAPASPSQPSGSGSAIAAAPLSPSSAQPPVPPVVAVPGSPPASPGGAGQPSLPSNGSSQGGAGAPSAGSPVKSPSAPSAGAGSGAAASPEAVADGAGDAAPGSNGGGAAAPEESTADQTAAEIEKELAEAGLGLDDDWE